MKITNISDTNKKIVKQTIHVVLTTKGGTKRNIKLNPGEFVYGEKMDNNMPLRIFQKKGIVEVTEEGKPDELQNYTSYNKESIISTTDDLKEKEEMSFSKVIDNDTLESKIEEKVDSIDDKSSENENEEEDSNEQVSNITEDKSELEVEVVVPEDSISKNKGGRPKGSKNKSKRGRPKKKRRIGRPRKRR